MNRCVSSARSNPPYPSKVNFYTLIDRIPSIYSQVAMAELREMESEFRFTGRIPDLNMGFLSPPSSDSNQ